jgi:hypothetical protein
MKAAAMFADFALLGDAPVGAGAGETARPAPDFGLDLLSQLSTRGDGPRWASLFLEVMGHTPTIASSRSVWKLETIRDNRESPN